MITLEKPASLPPIVIVTQRVLVVSEPSWLLSTSPVWAPEHAVMSSSVFGRWTSTSSAYA